VEPNGGFGFTFFKGKVEPNLPLEKVELNDGFGFGFTFFTPFLI